MAAMTSRETFPQIIAHRGASGYVPEHSLAAYQLAIDLGTDYIEPDVVLSKDGIFIVMHDLLLDDTTNVADHPEFSDRKSTKIVNGIPTTGFFVCDFLESELKTLRLRQRMSQRTSLYNDLFPITTLDDVTSFVWSQYNSSLHTTGIYVELKHPSFHASLGFAMEDMLLMALNAAGYMTIGENTPNNLTTVVPVVIQCFESPSLEYLHSKTALPLVQLIEKGKTIDFWSRELMTNISQFAQGIGPYKDDFSKYSFAEIYPSIQMIQSDLKLFIHPWTFRKDSGIEEKFLNDFQLEEMYFYCCLGECMYCLSL
jgi:glycerophosphoryl diester phosphodiesterase